jgi:hypothetical protein
LLGFVLKTGNFRSDEQVKKCYPKGACFLLSCRIGIPVPQNGDFVLNPNNTKKCVPLISRLRSITHRKNIGVLVTLHNNPAMNSEKARGVLDPELWRKSEAVLIIEKLADGTRKLTTDYALGKNRSVSDTISSYFKWDDEQKMHVSCQPPVESKGKHLVNEKSFLNFLVQNQYGHITLAEDKNIKALEPMILKGSGAFLFSFK